MLSELELGAWDLEFSDCDLSQITIRPDVVLRNQLPAHGSLIATVAQIGRAP
jgi:hypothetical protein